jgi:hypothetical protein
MIEKTIAIVFKVLWLFFCMVFMVLFDLLLFMLCIKEVMIYTCYFYDAATMLYETLIYIIYSANKQLSY